jgi:hypothetical protein|nr:MAG TPA: hypothetical protein [Caudoviricetes sp.]
MKQITPQEDIDKYLKSSVEELINETIHTLSYIGEHVVNTAKKSGKYSNQTGNLRSSLGYIISIDGEIVRIGGFEVTKDGYDGVKGGEALAQALAKTSKGTTLTVVAGMHYAVYVSAKGLDVLDSAEIELEKQLQEQFKNG